VDRLRAIEAYWSDQAGTFDDEPDHGLGNPHVRAAWAGRLAEWIPSWATRVADLGCGTGSLSVLLGKSGAEVVGIDLSPAMVEHARRKAHLAGLAVEFLVGDASDPDLAAGSFDVVLSRHLLWTLAEPVAVLSRWARLLKPRGRLVLIEGRWFDPSPTSAYEHGLPWEGGVRATELMEALAPLFARIDHYPLSEQAALWGKPVLDERYAVVAQDAVPLLPKNQAQ
jgi:ubiquinone/menaquinone biosynthesis C-methylase UbiE